MTLDLLAFGAHPDDVELSCGGWLALAATRGQRAGAVDLTRGELGTNGTPEQRAREAAAAAAVLGLACRDQLGLPDGGLRGGDPAQIDPIVAVLRRRRPTLALAPWREARHPDHVAASELVRQATFLAGLARYRPDLGAPARPRLLFYPERHEVPAALVVDTSAVHETKLAAIRCYASQLSGTPTMLTLPLGTEAFTVRDRYWGASIGVSHGEPYLLGGPVPVADPVTHFAAHPAIPVLVP